MLGLPSLSQRESTLSFLPPQAPSSGTLKAKKNAKIPTTTTPLPLNESDDWSVFLTVECRGMEVVGFDFEVSNMLCVLSSSPL